MRSVYPFRELDAFEDARIWVCLTGCPPGSLRYAANEAWGNLKARTLGRFDIYHPTTYLRMPMVRARRVIATHHECTHERFPELFPDVKKVLWARKWLFPAGGRHHLLFRVDCGKTFCIFTMSIRRKTRVITTPSALCRAMQKRRSNCSS